MSIATPHTHGTAAHGAHAAGSAIAHFARMLWQSYLTHRAHSAQRLLVASLSDRQLADLGIRRDQVGRRDFTGPLDAL